MAFITLGTATQLQIKVPTIGSTDWADTMRTDTFLKIAQHQHTGSGDGSQLGTGSIVADAITGAKLRLDNDEYIRARNNADSANVNILKIDTNDDLFIDAEIAKILLKNASYLTGRNNADSADLNILRINTSDKLEIATDLSNIALVNDTYLQARNNADSAYINVIKVNTSDSLVFGAEIDTIQTNNIEAGATATTLTDNTSVAATANVIALSTDESCRIRYRLVRNGVTQEGVLSFTDVSSIPAESYTGTDVGVTFSITSGELYYTTTNTGNNVSMYYTILK